MTFSRVLPHEARPSLLIALGCGLLLAPVALSMSAAALVAGLFTAVLAIGIGIAGTDTSGRGTIPVLAHPAYDRGLAAGLLFTALAFAAAGDLAALALFGAAGAAQVLVCANTRYAPAPAS